MAKETDLRLDRHLPMTARAARRTAFEYINNARRREGRLLIVGTVYFTNEWGEPDQIRL